MKASSNRALVAATLAFAPPVVAADPVNLLVNPGFETGGFTGWTVTGTSVQVGVTTDKAPIANAEPPFPPTFQNVRSGTFAGNVLIRSGPAVFPNSEGIVLTQTIAVPRGVELSAGFWIGNDSASAFGMPYGIPGLPGITQITVDGVGLLAPNALNVNPGSTPDAFVLLAASFDTGDRDSVEISFAITGSGTSRAVASFDDFFVVAGPIVAIPEPEIFGLLALGLGMAPFARRRAAHAGQR